MVGTFYVLAGCAQKKHPPCHPSMNIFISQILRSKVVRISDIDSGQARLQSTELPYYAAVRHESAYFNGVCVAVGSSSAGSPPSLL